MPKTNRKPKAPPVRVEPVVMLRPRDAALMGLASQLDGKERERIVARMSRSARRDFLATNTIKMLADWKANAKQHNSPAEPRGANTPSE